MAQFHYTNKLANLRNITNELVGLRQDQRSASCTACWALVLPEAQQVGTLEFINKQVVQQVCIWCTRRELVGQQVANLLVNYFV
jgi:hypothetical protein